MKMKQNFLLGAMALAGLFASCSQTEMEEAANVPQKGNEVTVTVAPSADFTQPRTRAESGQQLRYIAELWEEDKTTNPTNPKTKKLIARTEQVGADANKFTFDVEQQGDYVILFWADYIAAGGSTSEKTITGGGYRNDFTVTFQGYTDKEFKTNETNGSDNLVGLQKVSMNKPDNKSVYFSRTLEAFCGKLSFTKDVNIVNKQVTLKRPLCKYIFKEKNASALSTISNIVIKSFIFNIYYNVYNENMSSYNVNTGVPTSVNILNSSEQQLFTLYSFGGTTEGTLPTVSEPDFVFNFTTTDGSNKQDVKIKANQIPCRANYIYTLSGSFVQEDLTGTAVKVDVTYDENWTSEDKNVNN
ncbi:hypothetical protein [Parabacteroides pacaensis]|uniref:hypothetical protein n=1 Tax=Parabacteroides pacaensis TaxID=2086575 RepID=UPI000D0E362B|nr:hypothetical protein [Parabacteroides pacaensis]